MDKNKLTILVIDRPFKEKETAAKNILPIYGPKYDLIMFPPKEDDPETRIQLVFCKQKLIEEFKNLFSIRFDYGPNDLNEFFDFDIADIDEVLSQNFEIKIFNLTEVEK